MTICFFLIDIIVFLLFIFVKFTNLDNGTKIKTSIRCTFHEEEYVYEVTYFEEFGQIIEADGDSYLLNIATNLEYHDGYQLIDKIDAYIKNNGGTCQRKDSK